jgi:hypothetical protein
MTLVVLAPPLARDEHRGYKRTGDTWAHLDAEQRMRLGEIGVWLDTATMTPEQTVAAILAATP